MTFTPVPFNQIPVATSVPPGSQIITVIGGNLRRADFSLLPKGDPGADGAPGPQGDGITLLGTLADESDLPTSPTPNNGDAYFIGTNLFVYTVDEWVNTGSFKGEAGNPVEFQVADGFLQYRVVGDPVWINLISISNISGNTIYSEDEDPLDSFGNDGDLFINSLTGNLLEKQSGSWVSIGSLLGPQGENGSNGVRPITILGRNGLNTLTLDLSVELADITANERVDLGEYYLLDSQQPDVPVELTIFLGTATRDPLFQSNANGLVTFTVYLQLSNYSSTIQAFRKLVRLTITDDNSVDLFPSLQTNSIVFPLNTSSSTFSASITLDENQELRLDNTSFDNNQRFSVLSTVRNDDFLRLDFIKPIGQSYFILNPNGSNIEPLLTYFDSSSSSYTY